MQILTKHFEKQIVNTISLTQWLSPLITFMSLTIKNKQTNKKNDVNHGE